MTSRLAALVVLASLLAGCGAKDGPEEGAQAPPDATPAPPPPPPPPTVGSVVYSVGDTWRYAGEDGSVTVVTIESVANGTVASRSLSTWPDNGTKLVRSTLRADTLALVTFFDQALGFEVRFSPPLPILIPAEDHVYVGNLTVPTTFGQFAQPASATIRFLGLETVDVPAGTFETYRYNATLVSNGVREFRQESEIWFSPEAKQAVRTIVDGRAQELTGYELG